jgi:phage gp29-like protein
MDKAIAMVLQGQTLTSDIGEAGSRAASETHEEILTDYRQADETMLVTFMEELSWIYTQLNMPQTLSPAFRFREPEDYMAKAELANKMYAVGVRFLPPYFERHFQLAPDEFYLESGQSNDPDADPDEGDGKQADKEKDPDDPSEKDKDKKSGATLSKKSDSEPIPLNTIKLTPEQQAIEELILKSITPMDGLFTRVQEVLESSASFEEAKERILELYKTYAPKEMQVALQKGLLPASLFGRYVIQQQQRRGA